MADQQLKRLKQGVETWNQWRKEHPDEGVDLGGVDLSRANLSNSHTARLLLCLNMPLCWNYHNLPQIEKCWVMSYLMSSSTAYFFGFRPQNVVIYN